MTPPIDPNGSSDLEAGDGEGAAAAERHHVQRERLLAEVRRLEEAEQFAEALQAIRDSGLAPTDPDVFQPAIARLKQAARLQASYRRACEAQRAGDREAAARMAAVVAVDPRYKDAAKLLYEAVSGVCLVGLEAEVAASREAAARLGAERDRLARGRARLAWVAGAQGVLLCLLLGWLALRRPPPATARTTVPPAGLAQSDAVGGTRAPTEAEAKVPASPGAASPITLAAGPTPAVAAEPRPPDTVVAATAARRPHASPGGPDPRASGVWWEDDPPLDLDGPCHRIGESCSGSVECCFGSLCFGHTCQDTRRTIVFGEYRP